MYERVDAFGWRWLAALVLRLCAALSCALSCGLLPCVRDEVLVWCEGLTVVSLFHLTDILRKRFR